MTGFRTLLAVGALAMAASACGDDGPPPDRTRLLEPQPLTVSSANRGLALTLTDSLRSLAESFRADAAFASNVVVTEQIYSEFEHAKVGEQPRQVEPRFDRRIDATYQDDRVGAQIPNFEYTYWVVDLQRLDREWLVDWNGLERDEPDDREGSLTFTIRATDFESDYQTDAIDRVVAALDGVADKPDAVIIGAEMEQHYLAVPEDWAAYVTFVRQLAAAIRAASPGTRVGAGINWSDFADEVVPRFIEASGHPEVTYQAYRLAWEAVLDPLYFDIDEAGVVTPALDFYAFASLPDVARYASPSQLALDHYAAIATHFDEFPNRELPVAWFAIGWASNSASTDFWPAFYERFLDTAGGYPVELVSWWGYNHLNASSECPTMLGMGLGRSICNRGIYTPSGSPASSTLRDDYFAN
ncbi:MAG: hypothetical protein H6699_08885 [Myxococcales bacterium]|nr:hypothetical protein [Myxococcales bacterium]